MGGWAAATHLFYHLRKVRFQYSHSCCHWFILSFCPSLPLESHLLHIHKHVRGTHAARLWVGREHLILLARTCHQRISLLHEIMALLLLQHRTPLLLCAAQLGSIPRPHIICRDAFWRLYFPVILQGFMLLKPGNFMPPPAGTIPKSRLGRLQLF